MDNLEYIEAYLNEELAPEKRKEFEQRIKEDPLFAEEIGFYLSLKQAVVAEKIEKMKSFKEVYAEYRQGNHIDRQSPYSLRKLWPWVAAAAMLAGVILTWNTWFKPTSLRDLADKYVKENFQTLGVTMGSSIDSLQAGLQLYNEGRFKEALQQFENIANKDTDTYQAKKYAGIVSLRLDQYDKALRYFKQLENQKGLYANPGAFYQALTLMKRNLPGDKLSARSLLQRVVEGDLEGKEYAEKWLKKW